MAVLTSENLDATRQRFIAEITADNPAWRRQDLNVAIQAVEDVMSSAAVQNAFSTAIDNAITPLTMTVPHKRAFVKWYLRNRFDRGN